MATYSIFKKRRYGKDKLLSSGLPLEEAQREMKAWKVYSEFSHEIYYMIEETENERTIIT